MSSSLQRLLITSFVGVSVMSAAALPSFAAETSPTTIPQIRERIQAFHARVRQTSQRDSLKKAQRPAPKKGSGPHGPIPLGMQAVADNDYTAFLETIKGTPLEGKVSAELFAKMVKAHELMKANKPDEARAALEEIRQSLPDLPLPPKERGFHGKGLGKGGPAQIGFEAVSQNNYTAFLEAIKGTRLEGKVSADLFAKMVNAHTLMQDGKREEAHTLLREIHDALHGDLSVK